MNSHFNYWKGKGKVTTTISGNTAGKSTSSILYNIKFQPEICILWSVCTHKILCSYSITGMHNPFNNLYVCWYHYRLTLMVTLMALFMLPLYSQPCLVIPPFWEPREAVSCSRERHEIRHAHLNKSLGLAQILQILFSSLLKLTSSQCQFKCPENFL